MNEEVFPGPITVPLTTAKEWEKRYDGDTTVEEDKSKKVKAFLIPRESLVKVLELDTEAVWAYIGINDDKQQTLLFNGAKFDKDTGKWINVYGIGEGSEGTVGGGDVVYDGTRPSPPY